MAHPKSAEKRYRQSLKRQARNRSVRTLTRSAVRSALSALQAAPALAGEAVRQAVGVLDVAARKGVLHPNSVARRKSRLMARLNAASAAAASPELVAEVAPARRRGEGRPSGRAAPKAKTAATKTKAASAKAKPAAPSRGLRLGRKKTEKK